jgi:hypothetical protein
MMEDEEARRKEGARQQFEGLWEWSRFYHDAEIKVNGGSVIISAIASLAGEKVGVFPTWVSGAVIMIASGTALLSTLGYWRYYEFCDMYAKKFREEYLDKSYLDDVQDRLNYAFRRNHPILALPIFENIHHLVWIVTQALLFCLGLWIYVYGPST